MNATKLALIACLAACSFKSHAVVTYLTCPTLAPLPVTNFLPAAMLPIINAETAFDTGMNVTVMTAVNYASIRQTQAINDAFSTIMKSMIQTSRASFQQKIELDRSFDKLKQSYESELSAKEMQMSSMFFPGDTALQLQPDGTEGEVSASGPTYRLVKQLCNTGKIQQSLSSSKTKDKAMATMNRRNQKIVHNIQTAVNVNASAKRMIDAHYDLFCSAEDVASGLCEQESAAPNADMSAFNFLYPTGYLTESKSAGGDYIPVYTYSPVESLASYQYVKMLTGVPYIAPPTESERKDGAKSPFVGMYKQSVSATSLSAEVLLSISQKREPVNKEGLVMSELDLVAFQLSKNHLPENRRIAQTASSTGKMKEIQRQMALSTYLHFLILRQNDYMRQMDATNVAIDTTMETMSSN